MMLLKPVKRGALILALLVASACGQNRASSSLMLGGDVMLSRGGDPLFLNEDSTYSPWGDLLRVKQAAPVDLFAVNLESPFGEFDPDFAPNNLDMNLCADDASVALLQLSDVGLATTANNHAGDCDLIGIQHNAKVLEQAGIYHQGSGSAIQFIPVGEQVLAVFSLNDYSGDFDIKDIEVELSNARETSDLVMVSVHWGKEYQAGPSPHQQELAQLLVDAGADLVWGHHPHVLQRMEWLSSFRDGHAGLVLYSMGNLLSDQWMLPDALRTAVVRIGFSNHKIRDIQVIPLEMDMDPERLLLMSEPLQLDWLGQRLELDGLHRKGVTITMFDMGDSR
ncbi:MAG TPA: CapA family protein [Anaerolineaceae bacterium]|nr:CapA family protein [Anaerolineaceae bacterium]